MASLMVLAAFSSRVSSRCICWPPSTRSVTPLASGIQRARAARTLCSISLAVSRGEGDGRSRAGVGWGDGSTAVDVAVAIGLGVAGKRSGIGDAVGTLVAVAAALVGEG